MIRLLITGTGRCGTKYMARLLTASGLRCGHERVYHHRKGFRERPGLEAECSWAAVPHLEDLDPSVTVVHLVRHPLKVLESLVGLKRSYFAPGPHRLPARFMGHYVPRHEGESPAEIAARFILVWNGMIEPRAAERIRVEDQPDRAFLERIGVPGPIEDPPHDTNHNRRFRSLGKLPDTPVIRELGEMAERYGYDWSASEAKAA